MARTSLGQVQPVLTRRIPSTGEALPAVGLGTWITFNVGGDPVARDACAGVMRSFLDAGGRMIDSSPMYGSSQDSHRLWAAEDGARVARVRGRQGLDLERAGTRPDRALAPQVAGPAIRPGPGS